MRQANFAIIRDNSNKLLIRDLGPWDRYPTVTNDAEGVVERLAPQLRGRRLFYIDSEGQEDELLIKNGKFAGFAPSRSTF